MKKLSFTLFIVLICVISVFSQNAPYVANSNFSNAHLMPCPYDTSVMIYGYDEWEIYQTLNDDWNGPIDSTKCISVDPNNQWGVPLSIPLDQIDTTRRLFIVSKYNDSTATFAVPNYLFRIEAELNVFPLPDFNFSSSCDDSACSFFIIDAEIPDSAGNSTVQRVYQSGLGGFPMNNPSMFSQCYPTEKFDSQFVRRIGLALKFNTIYNWNTLNLDHLFINNPNYGLNTDTAIIAFPNGNDWFYQFGGYPNPTLLLFNAPTYPSPGNVDPVFVYPGTLPQYTQQQITLDIQPNSMVAFQPFTTLSGSPVVGQPGLYHNLTVIDNGGNFCFSYLDVAFHAGDKFLFNSGNVEFATQHACMQFRNGSTLEVGENATFNYGSENNMGYMLLLDSANLIIDKGGTLNVYTVMWVREQHTELGPGQFYTTLNPGSTLRFMPGSGLYNLYSVDNSIRLNVIMKGGILDDSGLPDDDRVLINRVYEADDLIPKIISIFPDPADENSHILLNSPEDEDALIQLFSAEGKLISSNSILLEKGVNEIPCSIFDLNGGIYFLKVNLQQTKESFSSSFIKQ